MEVFVFSYNRGIFLDNCVESIIANVKNPRITVIDDNSDDPETRSVLSRLPAGVRVITLERVKEQDYREGGFYNNIQHAVNVLAEEDVALFIEDDMQVVRPITQID